MAADNRLMQDRVAPERIGGSFPEVLTAAQAGADWAVAVLYRSLQPRLLRFLRAQAPNDAEDVASQVWLETARSLNRFSGHEDEFRALVFTVARRRLSDHRRAARRRPQLLVPDPAPTSPGGASAEDTALGRISGEQAARRIAELLPSDLAEIVLLRVVAGLSADEVATITGRRPGTVRVMQHRALKRLAAGLDPTL